MGLVLYDFPIAYFPVKARIVLVEKGLPYTTKLVNLLSSQSVSPAFLKVNPAGTIPILDDDGKLLFGSKDIVKAVDAKGEGPLGGSAVDRAAVDEWLDLMSPWDGNLFVLSNSAAFKGVGALINAYKKAAANKFMGQNPQLRDVYMQKLEADATLAAQYANPSVVAKNASELEALLDRSETALGKHKFLAGNAYSVADAMLTVILWRVGMVKHMGKFLKSRPMVSRFWDDMKARKSFPIVFAAPPPLMLSLALPNLFKALLFKTVGVVLL